MTPSPLPLPLRSNAAASPARLREITARCDTARMLPDPGVDYCLDAPSWLPAGGAHARATDDWPLRPGDDL